MRMRGKTFQSFAVIGLGKFGISLAETLADANYDVMVVDDNEDNIQEVVNKVTYAVKADITEPGVMESLEIGNMDVVVVGISENKEASIMAVFQAKDAGVPYVLAKALDPLHGKILKRVGADRVIYPEISTGIRVAKNLMSGGFQELFELASDFSMVEFQVPQIWVGKSFSDIDIRKNYHVNVIGIKRGDEVDMSPSPTEEMGEGDILLVVGQNEKLNGLAEI